MSDEQRASHPSDRPDFADVEIYIRPAAAHKGDDTEHVFESSYKDFAEWSAHSVAELVADLYEIDEPGRYEVGIRQEGDEQYWQRFEVVEPHAEERAQQSIENHLHGVLNHWRA